MDAKGILKTAAFLVLSTTAVIGITCGAAFAALSTHYVDDPFVATMTGLAVLGIVLLIVSLILSWTGKEEWILVHADRIEKLRHRCAQLSGAV